MCIRDRCKAFQISWCNRTQRLELCLERIFSPSLFIWSIIEVTIFNDYLASFKTSFMNLSLIHILSPTYSPPKDFEIQEYERTISEQAKNPIQTVASPVLSINTFLSKTKELLERKIGSSNKITELLHDIALNEWVKTCLLYTSWD